MDERLKHRLVGAAVWVSLGVIFIPMVLQEPRVSEESMPLPAIPPEPEAAEDMPALPAPAQPSPSSADTSSEAEQAPEIRPLPGEGPETDQSLPSRQEGNSGVPRPMEEVQQAHLTAWAVQLASFPKPDKALTLRDRLRKRGYPAFVTSAAEEPSAAARVLVGPALFEEKAQEIASKLERDLHLKGVVVQYPPN